MRENSKNTSCVQGRFATNGAFQDWMIQSATDCMDETRISFIREKVNGSILFIGRVTRPPQLDTISRFGIMMRLF